MIFFRVRPVASTLAAEAAAAGIVDAGRSSAGAATGALNFCEGRVVTGVGAGSAPADSVLALYVAFEDAVNSHDCGTTQRAAAVTTRLIAAAVPGVEQASITIAGQGRFHSAAWTGTMAADCDRLQRELGSGPTLTAVSAAVAVLRCDDVDVDDRWPEFARHAQVRTGVVSVLAIRLYCDQELSHSAVLTLYSTQRAAFDDTAQAVATVLARSCGRVVAVAAHRDKIAHLERALDSNREIGTAMGILMATSKVTRDNAFALLRSTSQNSNRKLIDIAADVVDTGILDPPPRSPSTGGLRPPDPWVGAD